MRPREYPSTSSYPTLASAQLSIAAETRVLAREEAERLRALVERSDEISKYYRGLRELSGVEDHTLVGLDAKRRTRTPSRPSAHLTARLP